MYLYDTKKTEIKKPKLPLKKRRFHKASCPIEAAKKGNWFAPSKPSCLCNFYK